MEGSGLIDCIPQTGKCPHNCDSCFYNNGFYRTLDEPLIPSVEESEGRIVRVNSGHDSALQKDLVLKATELYHDKFYNTSTTDLDFPAPVVMTANPARLTDKGFHKIENPPKNLMFVRARVNLWNVKLVADICYWYSQREVPVVLTYMRYSYIESIPETCRGKYDLKSHIINSYYSLPYQVEFKDYLWYSSMYPHIYYCGSYFSSSCRTCGNCLREYYATKERITDK